MMSDIKTIEELDAVLHWRNKHVIAIKERDALQQRLNVADQRIDELTNQQAKPVMKLEAERLWEGDGEYSVSFTKAGWLDECRKVGGTFFLYTSPPAPVSVVPSGGYLRVEVRQCDNCNHVGINDSAVGVGACHSCEWQGVEPTEDKCPGCDSKNCMAAACPKCGARYALLAEENLPGHQPPPLDKVKELNS